MNNKYSYTPHTHVYTVNSFIFVMTKCYCHTIRQCSNSSLQNTGILCVCELFIFVVVFLLSNK